MLTKPLSIQIMGNSSRVATMTLALPSSSLKMLAPEEWVHICPWGVMAGGHSSTIWGFWSASLARPGSAFGTWKVDWLDWTVIFGLDQTGPKNFGPVLDFWDWTVKQSPLFDGTGLYMVWS